MESGASLNLDVDAWGDDGQSCVVYWLGLETNGVTLNGPRSARGFVVGVCCIVDVFLRRYVCVRRQRVREMETGVRERTEKA